MDQSTVQQSNGAYFSPEKKYISTHHERGQFQNPKSKEGFRILDHLSKAVVDKSLTGGKRLLVGAFFFLPQLLLPPYNYIHLENVLFVFEYKICEKNAFSK